VVSPLFGSSLVSSLNSRQLALDLYLYLVSASTIFLHSVNNLTFWIVRFELVLYSPSRAPDIRLPHIPSSHFLSGLVSPDLECHSQMGGILWDGKPARRFASRQKPGRLFHVDHCEHRITALCCTSILAESSSFVPRHCNPARVNRTVMLLLTTLVIFLCYDLLLFTV
jgi:hypothetical protein